MYEMTGNNSHFIIPLPLTYTRLCTIYGMSSWGSGGPQQTDSPYYGPSLFTYKTAGGTNKLYITNTIFQKNGSTIYYDNRVWGNLSIFCT